MFPTTIADYYRAALESIRQEVQDTADTKALGMDPKEWITYSVKKYGMEPVEVDPEKPMTMVETSAMGAPAVRVLQPLIWTNTLDAIGKQGLAGSPFSVSVNYRDFFDPQYPGTIGLTAAPEKGEINAAKARIGEYMRSLNSAINQENQTFPGKVHQIVTSKQDSVRAKHQKLDELAAAVGVPLVKRADISTVVPTAVKVRQKIAPVVPPTPKAQQRPVLEREMFNIIIDLIDNQCRQFERTPTVFQGMSEEGLRDIILSSLNAVFEGAAAGEVFQGLGRTDVHLRISQGEVFVAELKIWGGPSTLAEVISQLLNRLTWRDAFGVSVVISKNAEFSAVLQSVEATLPRLPGAITGSFRKTAENAFVAFFSLPSDRLKQVEIHVWVFNLFIQRPSERT